MHSPNKPPESAIDTANQLHRSALRLLRLLRTARPANGLSSSKLSVLGRLYQGGEATATDLATYLRIQPQSLTRLIADLERQKLISRRRNDADRRQSLLEITEAGRNLLIKELAEQRLLLAQAIAKGLTPAEQDILRIAAGLIDRVTELTETELMSLEEPRRNENHEERAW